MQVPKSTVTFDKPKANERTVQRWFNKFRSGNTSPKDKTGRGRPTSVDDERLKAVVEANPRTIVREIS